MDRKGGEERRLTSEGIPVRAVLELVDGEVPVGCDSEEDVDDVQQRTASLNS
jgi:hypothetical protein